MAIFQKVNLIFLIKGHNKNLCNRMFNIMKQNHTKRNIYTLEETHRILGLEGKVTLLSDSGKFWDWDKEFDMVQWDNNWKTDQNIERAFNHRKKSKHWYNEAWSYYKSRNSWHQSSSFIIKNGEDWFLKSFEISLVLGLQMISFS